MLIEVNEKENKLADLIIGKRTGLKNMSLMGYGSPGWMQNYQQISQLHSSIKKIYKSRAIRN